MNGSPSTALFSLVSEYKKRLLALQKSRSHLFLAQRQTTTPTQKLPIPTPQSLSLPKPPPSPPSLAKSPPPIPSPIKAAAIIEPPPPPPSVELPMERLALFYSKENLSSLLIKKERPPKGLIVASPKNQEEELLLSNLQTALIRAKGGQYTLFTPQIGPLTLEAFIEKENPDWILIEPSLLPPALEGKRAILWLSDLALYIQEPSLKRILWNRLLSQMSSSPEEK